jgi:hypothetical protein
LPGLNILFKYIKMTFLIKLVEIILILILFVLSLSLLSANIFELWFPDVSVQYSVVKTQGFFKTIIWNWCCVSIGRISGIIWIDFWLKLIQLLGLNSLWGLVLYRIITFAIIILSFYFLIKFFKFSKNKILTNLLLSLTIFTIFIFITDTYVINQIFDVDLAIYGIPIAYTIFFIIFALKIHNIDDPKRIDLFLFYLFLVLYLNSVYAHLVTGGLILYFALFTKEKFFEHLRRPLYSFQNIFFHNFLKENYNYLLGRITIIKPESIFALGFIFYFLSALINLLSPSLAIREEIWPSDTSLLLGLYNSLPVLEGLILNEWSYYYLLITAIVAVLSINNQINISKYSLLLRINLILLAPILVILINALTFSSSSLHVNIETNPILKNNLENLFLFKNVLVNLGYNHGLWERHIFFLNGLALISYIFVGLEIGNLFKKKYDK